jgi:hypothetical protein
MSLKDKKNNEKRSEENIFFSFSISIIIFVWIKGEAERRMF